MGGNNPHKPAAEWPEWTGLPVTEYCRLSTPWPLHYLLNPKQLSFFFKSLLDSDPGHLEISYNNKCRAWGETALAPSCWGCETAVPRAAARGHAAQCWGLKCRRQPSFLEWQGSKETKQCMPPEGAQWDSKQGKDLGLEGESFMRSGDFPCKGKWSPFNPSHFILIC